MKKRKLIVMSDDYEKYVGDEDIERYLMPMNERMIKLAASQIPNDAKFFTAKLASHAANAQTGMFDISACGRTTSTGLRGIDEVLELSKLKGIPFILEGRDNDPRLIDLGGMIGMADEM